jgi:hypothetical protein
MLKDQVVEMCEMTENEKMFVLKENEREKTID